MYLNYVTTLTGYIGADAESRITRGRPRGMFYKFDRGKIEFHTTTWGQEDTQVRKACILGTFGAVACLLVFSAAAIRAGSDDDGGQFQVTVTNLTAGQSFTPILVASHKKGLTLFTLGQPASANLQTLAETGNPAPLAAELSSSPDVKDVTTAAGLTGPGQSITLMVNAGGQFLHVSVAAMLIPTNDGFFAVNGIGGPKGDDTLTVFSPAYDAGTEKNDESCLSIPGPFFPECGGPGGSGHPLPGEGFVFIHGGIHGVGSFSPAARDWRNPVAKITIRRTH